MVNVILLATLLPFCFVCEYKIQINAIDYFYINLFCNVAYICTFLALIYEGPSSYPLLVSLVPLVPLSALEQRDVSDVTQVLDSLLFLYFPAAKSSEKSTEGFPEVKFSDRLKEANGEKTDLLEEIIRVLKVN